MNVAVSFGSVSAEFVAEVIVKAMDRKSIEVFVPPERARLVRMLRANLRSMKTMVEQSERIGALNLEQRRAALAQAV